MLATGFETRDGSMGRLNDLNAGAIPSKLRFTEVWHLYTAFQYPESTGPF